MTALSNFSFFSSLLFSRSRSNEWWFQAVISNLTPWSQKKWSVFCWMMRNWKRNVNEIYAAAFSPSSASLAYEIRVFIFTNTCVTDNNFCFLALFVLPALLRTSWLGVTAELKGEVVQGRYDVMKLLLALIQDHCIVPKWQELCRSWQESISKNAVPEVHAFMLPEGWISLSDFVTIRIRVVSIQLCSQWGFVLMQLTFLHSSGRTIISCEIHKRMWNIFLVVSASCFFSHSASAPRREAAARGNKSCEGTQT